MKSMFTLLSLLMFLVLASLSLYACAPASEQAAPDREVSEEQIRQMVYKHAEAWKMGNLTMLDEVLHEDVVFAYPGRRLDKNETLADLEYFRDHFVDTEVYIHTIIVEGSDVAVEWQFATTNNGTGYRQVVSDAIIGKVEDGKFVIWKEYLDGRVKILQKEGELALEEGEEPFPWPLRVE